MAKKQESTEKSKIFSFKDEFASIDWKDNTLKINITKKLLIILGIILIMII